MIQFKKEKKKKSTHTGIECYYNFSSDHWPKMFSLVVPSFFVHSNYLFSVYWSCQFVARASNSSLKHWQQMGGVNINEDLLIDKTIHRAINSPSAVLKVRNCSVLSLILKLEFLFWIIYATLLYKIMVILRTLYFPLSQPWEQERNCIGICTTFQFELQSVPPKDRKRWGMAQRHMDISDITSTHLRTLQLYWIKDEAGCLIEIRLNLWWATFVLANTYLQVWWHISDAKLGLEQVELCGSELFFFDSLDRIDTTHTVIPIIAATEAQYRLLYMRCRSTKKLVIDGQSSHTHKKQSNMTQGHSNILRGSAIMPTSME